MLRIALISEHASPLAVTGGVDAGGQNIYVAHVARQLARAGHHVDVFTRRDDALLPEIARMAHGVRVVHVPAGPASAIPKEQMLPFMADFGDWVTDFARRQREPYHVIHANFFMSGLAALRVKAALGTPVVTTFHALGRVRRLHQGEADGFPDERFDIEARLVHESDRVIAECPQDLDDLVNLYAARPGSIDLVPCGFDVSEFTPVDTGRARRHLGWREDEFAILQLGRMVPRKGVDNVIRALAELSPAQRARARLYVVGGNSDTPDIEATPEIGRLQQVAREAGVAERVVFVGRRDRSQLRYLYSAADVFVTTPWYEPFGITPVEAMACGTAVIGARVGGIQHTVIDGDTGLLVPPKDPVALGRALSRLIDNPAMVAAFGAAGLKRARRRFTWHHVAAELAVSYARAAGLESGEFEPELFGEPGNEAAPTRAPVAAARPLVL